MFTHSDLIAKLLRRIERTREVQQQSREYRKRTEKLTADSQRLFTLAEQARQRSNGRDANRRVNSTADESNSKRGEKTSRETKNAAPGA